jgi:hypothetical protein
MGGPPLGLHTKKPNETTAKEPNVVTYTDAHDAHQSSSSGPTWGNGNIIATSQQVFLCLSLTLLLSHRVFLVPA